MPTPVYARCKEIVEAHRITHGEAGFTATVQFRVDGILGDTDFIATPGLSGTSGELGPLDFAMNLPKGNKGGRIDVPSRGDTRSTLVYVFNDGTTSYNTFVTMFCSSKEGRHPGDGKSSAIVTCQFQEIGLPVNSAGIINGSGNTFKWLVGAHLNGSTTNINTNFGWKQVGTTSAYTHGKLLQVYYKRGVANYDYTVDSDLIAETPNYLGKAVLSQYANVPSLESMSSIQIHMREIVDTSNSNVNLRTPAAKQAYYNGCMNKTEIWGRPAGTLRMRVMTGEVDVLRSIEIVNPNYTGGIRTKLWDTFYLFEYRARGWKELATLKIPQTGFEPPDIDDPATGIQAGKDHGNGWGLFAPLREVEFSELGLPDVRAL